MYIFSFTVTVITHTKVMCMQLLEINRIIKTICLLYTQNLIRLLKTSRLYTSIIIIIPGTGIV